MRLNYFILSLILFPLCAFSESQEITEPLFLAPKPANKNIIVKTFSHQSIELNQDTPHRSVDYPTQIIRLSSQITNQQLDCQQVNDEIDRVFIKQITRDKFTYTTYVICEFDPETHYATQFALKSYFDPINDKGVSFLNNYLQEYNGSNLLGTQLNIESAKALIVSLSISTGTKKNPKTPPFIEYREDRSNFYFKSNYEMRQKLFADIEEDFFSNDPDKILPFLDKWLFSHAGQIYKSILRDSNYVLLQPEQIFLMETGEELFISDLKVYFAHNCTPYENHSCLKPSL
jgi:hypothetical protein